MKKPYCLMIGGMSASGKSTLAGTLAEKLNNLDISTAIIGGDKFFRDELPVMTSPISGRQFDDCNSPDSIDSDALYHSVRDMLSQAVDIVIVEGISVLCFDNIRKLADTVVYVDASVETRLYRRIRRNLEWGSSLHEIGDYYVESARFGEMRNFEYTRAYASVIINGDRPTEEVVDMLTAYLKSKINR